MEEYNVDKALNIRVSKDHLDKNRQKQMIGLFKHNAYQLGLTQAEYMANLVEFAYNNRFIKPMSDFVPAKDEIQQMLLDEVMND